MGETCCVHLGGSRRMSPTSQTRRSCLMRGYGSSDGACSSLCMAVQRRLRVTPLLRPAPLCQSRPSHSPISIPSRGRLMHADGGPPGFPVACILRSALLQSPLLQWRQRAHTCVRGFVPQGALAWPRGPLAPNWTYKHQAMLPEC